MRCAGCEAKQNRRRTKCKWLVLCAGVLVLAAMLLSCAWNGSAEQGSLSHETYPQPSKLFHETDASGSNYIPLPDGSFIDLQETEIIRAVMTADRKHILVWQKDGSVYMTDPELKEKHPVAGPKSLCYYNYCNDAAFCYEDAQGVCYRVTFADRKQVSLGQDISIRPEFAQNSATMLYGAGQAVYVLPADSAEPQKIGTCTGEFFPVAISRDGQLAVWVETEGTTQTLCMYDGKETHLLHQVRDEDTFYGATVSVTFSRDQKMAVIRSYKSNLMWLKNADADPVKVSFQWDLITFETPVYTNVGILQEHDAREIDCLYIPISVYAGMHLYRVSVTGESALVLEDAVVYNYAVIGGQVFYSSKNDVLYCAKLSGSTVQEATQIAKNVEEFRVSRDGKYVYYLQTEDQPNKLFCYRVDTAQTYTIAEDVAWGMASETLYLSPDGSTVLFFRDKQWALPGVGIGIGTLMQWNEQGSAVIAENVVMDSVTSGSEAAILLPDSISYLQYDAATSAQQLCGNRMYFDGKQHHCVIESICLGNQTIFPEWILE